mmetsp:Transcript_15087/g.27254  ORF Transcript_15087/g.27254 Transcript_15087/m.27254 type:complete len:245 (+) Transcript_15087:85-819(+)|eukprot:CAMPEP_0201628252 /NCGR_PEP_ID=MMETSP0493-20130528/3248_1 /ASSEMBLY_ACC=CAM_ASM_000838 /TAXON_ID=420259 /ORGANISM="Thalassiosira gravida, Strain GMp14c1" /LENGTH=244 /DNA_ID=CAMNT_0048098959 /DNA_START=20 /DNA_END=754 /DNA_ORIENTATION=+
MKNMDDQQWEFWDYDASFWDCVPDYDHGTASDSALTTVDDNDDNGDHHQQQPALSLRQKPISNLSPSFLGDEEDNHLFAASMFRGSSRGNVYQYLEFDEDNMSVDSECTVQACNKTTGGLDDSTKTEESNDSANTTPSCKNPMEVNAILFEDHEEPISIRRRSRSNTHLHDNHSKKKGSFSAAAGEKETSSTKHEIAPVSNISLSDTHMCYPAEPTEMHHRRRRGSWPSGRRVAGVGGGRALAA